MSMLSFGDDQKRAARPTLTSMALDKSDNTTYFFNFLWVNLVAPNFILGILCLRASRSLGGRDEMTLWIGVNLHQKSFVAIY